MFTAARWSSRTTVLGRTGSTWYSRVWRGVATSQLDWRRQRRNKVAAALGAACTTSLLTASACSRRACSPTARLQYSSRIRHQCGTKPAVPTEMHVAILDAAISAKLISGPLAYRPLSAPTDSTPTENAISPAPRAACPSRLYRRPLAWWASRASLHRARCRQARGPTLPR
jgi:hypothetical protein